MLLYHGTSESRARIIMAEGLKPRGKTRKSNWKHTIESNPKLVYLTDAYPLFFALTASEGDERWAVIEVDTDLLDESKLHPDEDVMEQAGRKFDHLPKTMGVVERTRWYRKRVSKNPNWRKSLEAMGTCGYYGKIPPDAITRVSFFDHGKYPTSFVLSAVDCQLSLMNYRFCAKRYRTYTKWVMGGDITPDDLGYHSEIFPELAVQVQPVLDDKSGIEIVKMPIDKAA